MSTPILFLVEKFDGHPVYDVSLDGCPIGAIEGNNPTFERSSKGKRYVNARWRSKRRYWKVLDVNGKTILRDVSTRKLAVDWLVSFHTKKP